MTANQKTLLISSRSASAAATKFLPTMPNASASIQNFSPSLTILFHMLDRWSLNTTRKPKKKNSNAIFLSVSMKKSSKKGDVSSESPARNITILRRSRSTLISTCPASSVKSSRAKKSLSILMQSTWHCLFFVFLIVKTSSIRNPSFLLSYDGYYAAATIYLILQRTKSSKFNHRDTRLKTAFGY